MAEKIIADSQISTLDCTCVAKMTMCNQDICTSYWIYSRICLNLPTYAIFSIPTYSHYKQTTCKKTLVPTIFRLLESIHGQSDCGPCGENVTIVGTIFLISGHALKCDTERFGHFGPSALRKGWIENTSNENSYGHA
jgi:hypothetical protein